MAGKKQEKGKEGKAAQRGAAYGLNANATLNTLCDDAFNELIKE